ncbi:TonB-dependent receptor [Litoribacter alkaliphilus]|uniref:TonB-dependent receptor n=1 Tax=Litoribacter ruber TaxID=702568 RepID=A0AAP2CHB8_9BACT|nr:TonB-dependent receptor [Litoribacter alkaliphilus]MBS9523604.1 TonB-dependent receptor [Litoribacter alkaliphilus]
MILVFLGIHFNSQSQQVRINGIITDAASGESLIGASVFLPQSSSGASANEYGFYSLKERRGHEVTLRVSYVGYKSQTLTLLAEKDTAINFRLTPQLMEEVVVIGDKKIEKKSISKVNFNAPALLEYPSFKPDVDILNVLQQQSGVQPGLEGSIGFSVRGGNNDQNLILMDNIPLYNTGHLAGFVSIFDPFAINSMTFYKGGFPAQYGGRISSVTDIYLKEGDLQSYHGEANIGLFSGKIALEGPIVKDKSSFLVSFRRSTIDLFLQGMYALQQNTENKFNYNYHDLNVKLNHIVDEKNRLFFSFYSGGDKISTVGSRTFLARENVLRTYNSSYRNDWGNRFASLRWNRVLGGNLFYNLTLAYSDFGYNLSNEDEVLDNGEINLNNSYHYRVAVRDFVLKNDFDFNFSNQVKFKAGLHLTAHHFQPLDWEQSRVELEGLGSYENRNFVELNAFDGFVYLQSDISLLNNRLQLHPGIRAGKYFLPESDGFLLLEPRFNAAYDLAPDKTIQADYARMGQTVHSLNSSGTSLTPDIWIPVTDRLRPAISDQVSFSYSQEWEPQRASVQMGMFYKEMQNLIEFNQSSGFGTIRENWDEQFAHNGFGQAYGFEISGDKQYEKFRFEGNYTFSRSLRRFDELNGGEVFAHNFDRPHNITLTSLVRLNQKTTLSLLWTYQTGQPMTLGTQTYNAINNHRISLANYADQPANFDLPNPNPTFFEDVLLVRDMNNYRMPDYHRLDLALSHRKRWRNNWVRTFSVNVYNAYNRQNAYFIYTEKTGESIGFRQFSLFPILPTVSYGVKF